MDGGAVMCRYSKRFLGLMLFILASSAVMARELSTEELERWFESDELLPPSDLAINVNEGNLVFLDQKPDKPVHHHTNHLIISKHSLETGWVWLKQCHENLDQVPRAQILFRRGRVRDLQIITSTKIAESWVENNSVQLRDVRPGARLCVTAWTRALESGADGQYTMRNGPFMRKFLDGYYPMHVSMDINFTGTGLRLISVSPKQQVGFAIDQQPESVSFDAWFEGRLKTELMFDAVSS